MHTTYHKISARERDTAPRYYYKRTKSYTCCQRIKNFLRAIIAFFFTQVGVCALVAVYMVLGAHMFSSLEADSQMDCAEAANLSRNAFAKELWEITMRTNVLFRNEWENMTNDLLYEFQNVTVENVRKGYTGNDVGVKIWTFSSALMFSLTVFTTIGYGTLTPKTDLGKLITIFYALLGIPLMLLYMTTIGHIMGKGFKFTYTKFCRCKKPSKTMPSKASLPSALVDPGDIPPQSIDSGGRHSKQSSSRSKMSSNSSNNENMSKSPFLRPLKSFKKKKTSDEETSNTPTSISYRRPSLIVTEAINDGSGENQLKPPESVYSPPSPAHSLLKAPNFLKGSMTPSTMSRKRHSGSFPRDADDITTPDSNQKIPTVEFKLVEDLRLVTIPVTSCLMVLVSYIALGTVLFSTWEGWSYMDGAYFCFISLMTIGFGDFVPGNSYIYMVTDDSDVEVANAKLVIGTVYILFGMAILGMCLNLMQEQIVVQVRTALRRLGLIRPARFDDDLE